MLLRPQTYTVSHPMFLLSCARAQLSHSRAVIALVYSQFELIKLKLKK
jgi:hypothetical protein